MSQELDTTGAYLEKNPLWHADEAPWKASYVLRLMARNGLAPATVCDVCCGTGEVLRIVQQGLGEGCRLVGYDISPQAIALAERRANERLVFRLGDVRDRRAAFDVLLLMDVVEHLEDYFSLLRDLRPMAEYKIVHIPLDISVRSVLRGRLSEYRAAYGHIHYFTKDVALRMLEEAGYEVVDYVYTWQENPLRVVWNEHRHRGARTLARKLAGYAARTVLGLPGRIFFALNPDLAVRVLGGWRLLVLTR